MVEKLNKVIEELKQSNRDVWLLAVLKMDEVTGRWTVVVSAPWVTPENHFESFQYVMKILEKHLSEEELKSIIRLGLLPKDKHLVAELLTRQSGTDISEQKINGNYIYEGYIALSQPELKS